MYLPCYVSGKGMHATDTTWSFKTSIIATLEDSGLGYDTRYHYYQQQFPEMNSSELARMICDPMENYDKNWPSYREGHRHEMDEARLATAFMLELDNRFRDEAQLAITCYDEAGFGSGINAMVFLQAGKPILGFYSRQQLGKTLNLSNILQLEIAYPDLFTLYEYQHSNEIQQQVLSELQCRASRSAD